MQPLPQAQRSVVDIIRGAYPFHRRDGAEGAVGVEDWDAVVSCAERQGLTALLYAAVSEVGVGLSPAPPAEIVQRLRLSSLRDAATSIRARAELGRLLDLFAEQGIAVVVLKGSALAATVYRNPAHRSMCDLDLLVRRGDMERVVALLRARGYTGETELGEGFTEVPSSEVFLLPSGDSGYIVEPHWHILYRPDKAGAAMLDWLWEHTTALTVDGREAQMFTPEAQLLHLATHLVMGHRGSGLRPAYDMALVLTHYAERLDWEVVTRAAQDFGLVAPLRAALAYVSEVWGVSAPDEERAWLSTYRPSLSERVALLSARMPGIDAKVLGVAASAPGLRAKMACALHMVFPSRKYMRWRYGEQAEGGLMPLYARRLGQGLGRLFAMLRNVVGEARRGR